ncbi:MAG: SPASM domain-containing protein [Planctomycetes bacterium]|nr:SPASM domain-containing protein [Planctomycetota bacterium]
MTQGPETSTLAVLNCPRNADIAKRWLASDGAAARISHTLRQIPCIKNILVLIDDELPADVESDSDLQVTRVTRDKIQKVCDTLRMFSPTGYREGVLQLTAMDEVLSFRAAIEYATENAIDRVLFLPAGTHFLDTESVRMLLETKRKGAEDSAFRYLKAPQGYMAFSWLAARAAMAVEEGRGPGSLFVYDPDGFCPYPTSTPAAFTLASEFMNSQHCFRGDTRRGEMFCDALEHFVGNDGWSNRSMAAVHEAADSIVTDFKPTAPRFMEIEICSERNYTPTDLLPARPLDTSTMDAGLFRSIVDEYSKWDDATLLIGGHGEPFRHPDALALIEYAARKLSAVAVRTDGFALDTDTNKRLIDAEVAMVSVTLGNWGREAYREINGIDEFDNVLKNMRDLVDQTVNNGHSLPVLSPEVIKTPSGESGLEAFMDSFWPGPNWPVIRGHNDFCGRLPSLATFELLPRIRNACRRLSESMYIRPNGDAALCAQDVDGQYILGNVSESLESAFQGQKADDAREAHRCGAYEQASPLCARCKSWATL